jgi:hypothetical protein
MLLMVVVPGPWTLLLGVCNDCIVQQQARPSTDNLEAAHDFGLQHT